MFFKCRLDFVVLKFVCFFQTEPVKAGSPAGLLHLID